MQAATLPLPFLSNLFWWRQFWLTFEFKSRLHLWASREVEERRLFLFLPVAFGLGILLFFQAEGRPGLWPPLIGAGLAGLCAFACRQHFKTMIVMTGLAALFLGFAASVWRTEQVEAPVLNRIIISPMQGFIEVLEEREEGARLLVRVQQIKGLAKDKTPKWVRITTKRDVSSLKPGDYIDVMARLSPPSEPARPGGYDFARDAFFKSIGGIGSALGAIHTKPSPVDMPTDLKIASSIDAARNDLTKRMAEAIGGQSGAVSAALVSGKRGLIDEESNATLRAAGIYHIVSISGLHMVLAAGTIFWLVRRFLALLPIVPLIWPIKKIAAMTGILGAFAYAVFSGMDVATERSLIMIWVMLGAVLFDRPALSMRNLAVTALIVLIREPEALLGPSFQMSFGAVAGLSAFSEWERRRVKEIRQQNWLIVAWNWLKKSIIAAFFSTMVASLATMPFGAFHFQTLNPYGLIGNMITVPLISGIVMPSAVLGVLALPFGLDRPIWQLMGYAVSQVLLLSQWVQNLAGSSVVVPASSVSFILLFSVGLVLLTFLVSPLRYLSLVPLSAVLMLAFTPVRYDLYMDQEGKGAAIRSPNGFLVLMGKPSAFIAQQWLRADGDARQIEDDTLRQGVRCDSIACTTEAKNGKILSFVLDRRAFYEDCERADIILSSYKAPSYCKASIILDRNYLQRHGAVTGNFSGSEIIMQHAKDTGAPRPWSRRIDDRGAKVTKPVVREQVTDQDDE